MVPSKVTSVEFRAWRLRMGLTHSALATIMGISINTTFLYERGSRLEGKVKIPLLTAWAMVAIESRLKPYGEKNDNDTNQQHCSN